MKGVVRGLGISCSFSLPVQELTSMKMEVADVGFGIAKRGVCHAHILSCVTPQDVVDTENLYQFEVKLDKINEKRVCKGLLNT